ncbi:ATP-binding protein [Micromonospora chersina]
MTRAARELFVDGGGTGRLMAALDWGSTPLGGVDTWSQSLRAAVRIVLSSRYPMLLLWGPQFTQLYNDAYSALIGDKHPGALGDDVRVTLAEGWDVLAPLIEEAMATGVASWVPALQLLLERSGYREEAYFSVSHAPARDDDGRTVGIFTVCSEVTEQVVSQRRMRLLRDLAVRGGDAAPDVDGTCTRLADTISGHPLDVPFAAVYLREGDRLRRAACTDDERVRAALPAVASDDDAVWGIATAAGGSAAETSGLPTRLTLPAGPWGDPVVTALALPLPSAEAGQPLGVLVAGVSPSRALDESYRSFYELLAQQVAVAVRNARAYEEERRRAEALAELDRVKTSFFTNVSHEFRTPLTLMLGPLADALDDEEERLSGRQRERVETAQRNATRLLGLVNNLLTFASVEAGRARSDTRRVDLAALTGELASVFRSAVERAGLRLEVNCPPLPRPVTIDPVNWERIVTNLLSNALKYTFVGRITVELHADETGVRLTVADTGIGISDAELPRLFDRFHRVPGVRSRSHEGTGIGLALVRELARLEGGDVRVHSRPGSGTAFTVTLPWTALDRPATATGPADGTVGAEARGAAREAAGWLADSAGTPVPALPGDVTGARILVVDDNVDMRGYLVRILSDQGWLVRAVGDGRQALEAIRHETPDLVLTDVMMPHVDGFELVRRLRRDPATGALPVLVLSARAGAEASVEGLALGADDYVVKPFTAAELIARIRAALSGARLRQGAAPAPPSRGAVSSYADPEREEAGGATTADAGQPAAPARDGVRRPDVSRREAVRAVDSSWTYRSEPASAASMRRDLRAALAALEADPELVQDLVTAASEAMNNAVEHAQHPSRPEVRVGLRVDGGRVRVTVRDFGTWRDRRPSMDRGRGATVMNACADVRLVCHADGTTVTLERSV